MNLYRTLILAPTALVALATMSASPAEARRCIRFDKTTGAVAGAVAGGLLGNVVAGRGNRTAGTLVGGAAGGVAGHVLAKNGPKHCR